MTSFIPICYYYVAVNLLSLHIEHHLTSYCGFGSFISDRLKSRHRGETMVKLTSCEHDWESFFFVCFLQPHLHCHRRYVVCIKIFSRWRSILVLQKSISFWQKSEYIEMVVRVKRKKCSLKLRNFLITISIGFFIDEEIQELFTIVFSLFQYAQHSCLPSLALCIVSISNPFLVVFWLVSRSPYTF